MNKTSPGESWGRIEGFVFWLIMGALLIVGIIFEAGMLIKRVYDWCRGKRAPEQIDKATHAKQMMKKPDRKGFGFGGI